MGKWDIPSHSRYRIVTPGTRWDREDGRDSRDRREREREEWKQPGFSWEEAAAKYAATAITEEKESVVPQPVEEQQVKIERGAARINSSPQPPPLTTD